MTANAATLKPGDRLPPREHTPDNVELMLYNAALWNGHRIHFDLPYAQEEEEAERQLCMWHNAI